MYKHGNTTIAGAVQSGNNKNITYLQKFIVNINYSNRNSIVTLGETTTNSRGRYKFMVDNDIEIPEGSIIYLTAVLNNIKLMSVIGTLDKYVNTNILIICIVI